MRIVKLLLLVGGLAVAAWLVLEHAPVIGASLAQVGWGFVPYMAASFLVYALDTWGWRMTFVPGQPPLAFGRLFGVRMAGEAVNKVTPLASMGGEPLKAYLITRDRATMTDAMASVAVAKNVMTLAQIAFIFAGVAAGIRIIPGREALLLGLAVFPALVLTGIVVTAVADLRLRRRRGGDPRAPSGADAALPRITRGASGALELWSRIADFYWVNPRAFGIAFVFFLAGWAAGALELLAGSHALGFPLSGEDALVFEALLCGVNMATFFIPANAGSQEGGFALLAPLLGISSPHGVALAVLRRCRDALWIGFGLAYLALTEGRVLIRPEDRAPDLKVASSPAEPA